MNWNQLYYFHETAKRQSVKLAAKFLDVSTATLSEQIKKLEKDVGKKLFHRSPNRIHLTATGEETYQYTKEIFTLGQRMLDQVAKKENSLEGYAVNAGIQDNLFDLASLEFVSKYAELYAPFGMVNTERGHYSSELLERLIRGHYDWIITLEKVRAKNIRCQKIATYEVEFACLKEVYDRFINNKDLFRTIPLALGARDRNLSRKIKMQLAANGLVPEEIIESDHREYTWRLVERGRAIAPVTKEVTREAFADQNICYFKISPALKVDLYISWRQRSEGMVCIRKLQELSKTAEYPLTYSDPEYLIRVANVSEEQLK